VDLALFQRAKQFSTIDINEIITNVIKTNIITIMKASISPPMSPPSGIRGYGLVPEGQTILKACGDNPHNA
jgi:hypothetical protein